MKKYIYVLLIIFQFYFLCYSFTQDKQQLAIIGIELPYGIDKQYEKEIITQIEASIVKNGKYEVVHFTKETKEIKEALTDEELKRICSKEVALKIGKVLNLDLVIFGFVNNVEINKVMATCKLSILFKVLDVKKDILTDTIIKSESTPKVGYEGKTDVLIKEAIGELAKNFSVKLDEVVKIEKVEEKAPILPMRLAPVSIPSAIQQEEKKKYELGDFLLGAGIIGAIIIASRKKEKKEEKPFSYTLSPAKEALYSWQGYGTGEITTNSFEIIPPWWIVIGDITPTGSPNNFKMELYKEGGELIDIIVDKTDIATTQSIRSGSFYYTPGRYYLDITSNNITWQMSINNYGWPATGGALPTSTTIATFSGNVSKKTDIFEIPDRKWKVKETDITTDDTNSIFVEVYTINNELIERMEYKNDPAGIHWYDTKTIQKSGRFYLKINYSDIKEWLVEILKEN